MHDGLQVLTLLIGLDGAGFYDTSKLDNALFNVGLSLAAWNIFRGVYNEELIACAHKCESISWEWRSEEALFNADRPTWVCTSILWTKWGQLEVPSERGAGLPAMLEVIIWRISGSSMVFIASLSVPKGGSLRAYAVSLHRKEAAMPITQ